MNFFKIDFFSSLPIGGENVLLLLRYNSNAFFSDKYQWIWPRAQPGVWEGGG